MQEMRKERGSRSPVVNFHAWQVLKLLSSGSTFVRGLPIAGFIGGNTTLIKTVRYLVRTGLVSRRRSPKWPFETVLKLTDAGAKVLACFDQIDKIIERRTKILEG